MNAPSHCALAIAEQPSRPAMSESQVLSENLNRQFLGNLLASQRQGKTVLPWCLGMTPLDFIVTTNRYLPGGNHLILADGMQSGAFAKGQLRQELLELRRDEWRDVRDLLLAGRSHYHPLEQAMASIVAAGCLGGDHLWRDLGLPTRKDLGVLLQVNFRSLAEKNTADMKWKKFFYKQLCEQEGGYVCRAPSCEQCVAYDDCFGLED